jgi:outer membrane lipoprotein carrier protein
MEFKQDRELKTVISTVPETGAAMLRRSVARLMLVFAASSSFSSFANAITDFQSFVSTVQSGRAKFEQTVFDAKDKPMQKSNGTLVFTRPGKFRFTYEKPAQLIVGDGKKVSFFDQDLNQVTIKKLDQAFSGTPAALLAGKGEIDKAFTLVSSGQTDDPGGSIEWLDALPRQKDAGIDKMRVGFRNGDLAVMELNDAFGNRTRLTFTKFERNPKIDPKEYAFVPPKGADIIGE